MRICLLLLADNGSIVCAIMMKTTVKAINAYDVMRAIADLLALTKH